MRASDRARVALAQGIPRFVRRLLVVGPRDDVLAALLEKRGVVEVHGHDPDVPSDAIPERADLGSALTATLAYPGLPFPAGYFDGVAVMPSASCTEGLPGLLRDLAPLLSENGYVVLVLPDPSETEEHTELAALAAHLEAAGLGLYAELNPPESPGAHPAALPRVLAAVRATYHPLSHARAVLDAGQPEAAAQVLALIPAPHLEDPHVLANVLAENMLCLLAVDDRKGPSGRLERVRQAQDLFYRAVTALPHLHPVYRCQAEFWRRVGDTDMARRLLRSVLWVTPDEATRRQLESCRPVPEGRSGVEPALGAVSGEPGPRRVLYLVSQGQHYGLDVLYDGLCTCLGPENVVEFPYKPSYHGQPLADFPFYPCTFDRPGEALTLDAVVGQLEDGRFDLILFGDLVFSLDRESACRIVEAGRGLPVLVVDQLDDFLDNRLKAAEHLGLESVAGYFKREMLTTVDYGPDAFPCPYGYPDERVPADVSGPRTEDVFWSGHRTFGLRRLYLERIEQRLGKEFDTFCAQEEYIERLARARIGVNIFGNGFDTVRYWELPAHGCLLFSEHPPIRIPYDFRDAESAVLFDDAQEMEEKLTYYLDHPAETDAISRAGHEHFRKYHTASARARQMLARIEELLGAD